MMRQWLLLLSTDGDGQAIELGPELTPGGKPSPYTLGPPGRRFDIGLQPARDDDLLRCAQSGGAAGYALLWREGFLRQELSARFRLLEVPASVHGHSAELLFALAVICSVTLRSGARAGLAATGALDERGYVRHVEGVPAKLAAALDVLPPGAILFYPQADAGDVEPELRDRARSSGIELCAVERLDEAVSRLGIVLSKVYLDSPYRGLQAFEYAHRAIYFGRWPDIRALCERLKQRERAGRPGALVIAPSGAGKSSLVQAGVLPALQSGPLALPEPPTWAIWRPRDAAGQDESAIVASIVAGWRDANPPQACLAHDGFDALSGCWRDRPNTAGPFIWVVDQLEELFTLRLPQSVVTRFCGLLHALQQNGVWVIATLRSDFYTRYQEQQALRDVFGGDGIYDLAELDPAAIRQIIEGPAALADVEFETDASGVSLATRLQQDVTGQVNALPLLEFALSILYERRGEERRLSYSAYDDMGRLRGAIGRRAEQVFTALDAQARDALKPVLLALTVPAGRVRTAGWAGQPASLHAWESNAPALRLVQAFAQARLLEIGGDEAAGQRVRVAHEALLTHWKRASDVIDDSLADLLLRERLKEQAAAWRRERVPARLLVGGPPLAEGEALVVRLGDDAGTEVQEYVRQSRIHHRRRRLRAVGTAAVVAFALVGLLLLAARFSGRADQAEEEAARFSGRADQAEQAAALAVEAGSMLDINAARGQRLAVEAFHASDTPQTRAVLRMAAAHNRALAVALLGRDRTVLHLAFSPDRSRLISFGLTGLAEVWDIGSGRFLSSMTATAIGRPAFAPDGHRVVVDADSRTLLWDPSSGRTEVFGAAAEPTTASRWSAYVSGLDPASGSAVHVRSPDGRFIAVQETGGDIGIRSTDSDALLGTLEGRADAIRALAFSADGSLLASASDDDETALRNETVRLWDLPEMRQRLAFGTEREHVSHVAFSPDGALLVAGGMGETVRVWDTRSGKAVAVLPGHRGTVTALELAADGDLMATAAGDGVLRVWDARVLAEPAVLASQPGAQRLHAFSADGELLAAPGPRNAVSLWRIGAQEPAKQLIGHQRRVSVLAFSPDGRRLVSGGADTTAHVWDTGAPESSTRLEGHGGPVEALAFNADGDRLATVDFGGAVRVWDSGSGRLLRELPGAGARVNAVAFCTRPSVLAVATAGEIQLWDSERSLRIKTLQIPDAYAVSGLSCSHDGRLVVATTQGGSDVWLGSGDGSGDGEETMRRLSGHSAPVAALAFSADDHLLATASLDGTALIRSLRAGKEDILLRGHSGRVTGLAFAADGEVLVTTGEDATLRFWDVSTGQVLSVLEAPERRLASVAMKPSRNEVLALADNGDVLRWTCAVCPPPAEISARLQRRIGASSTEPSR